MNIKDKAWLVLLFSASISAQDIEVKKFEPMEKDQTAALSPRKDINGVTCGLVKVALKEPGAEFEGNVMGDVQFTGNEYLVYLPKGTKRLGIKHQDYLPTTIVFADYGTKKVESSTTYGLSVKANKKKAKVDNSKKGMAVFNIKPANALLLIDGQIADGSNGVYTLSLPYGKHYYTVRLKDFSINNQSVLIDKNAKNIDVDLTEYFAKVNVSCQTSDADIIINGSLSGTGQVTEDVIPGICIIEAQKEGFHTQSKTIELHENEVGSINFQELDPITGTLNVKTNVEGGKVFLDGKMIGATPLTTEIPVGEYELEIKHDYYRPFKRTIFIGEDQNLAIDDELVQTQLGKIKMLADQGNEYGMCLLAGLYLFGSENVLRIEDWGTFDGENEADETVYIASRDLFIQENVKIERDVEKAYFWYEKSKNAPKEAYTYLEWESIIDLLYACFLAGDGVKQDYDIAFSLLSLNPILEAWHYYYGKGVQRDRTKALEIFNELCRNYQYCDPREMHYKYDDYQPFTELNSKTFLKAYNNRYNYIYGHDESDNFWSSVSKKEFEIIFNFLRKQNY